MRTILKELFNWTFIFLLVPNTSPFLATEGCSGGTTDPILNRIGRIRFVPWGQHEIKSIRPDLDRPNLENVKTWRALTRSAITASPNNRPKYSIGHMLPLFPRILLRVWMQFCLLPPVRFLYIQLFMYLSSGNHHFCKKYKCSPNFEANWFYQTLICV